MRKHSFTLLELMVCLAVVATIASVLGWQIKTALDVTRFKSSAKIVKQEIEKLQLLALTFGSDMQLEIRKKDHKYIMTSTTDEAVLKKLNGREMVLEGVSEISWNNQINVKPLYLNILSNGRIVQNELLGLHQKERAYFLDMGVPLQLKFRQSYSRVSQPPKIPKKPKSLDESTKPSV